MKPANRRSPGASSRDVGTGIKGPLPASRSDSRASADRALEAHVLPSLATLLLIPPEEEYRVLDVGSGGGFPGIPLGILRPRVRLDLVEATRKKCRFLEECVRELGLEPCIRFTGAVTEHHDTLTLETGFELVERSRPRAGRVVHVTAAAMFWHA